MRMHDGRLRRDRSSHNIIGVRKVNYHYLVLVANFLAHANKMVRLERECLRMSTRAGELRGKKRRRDGEQRAASQVNGE